ncbi:MAG: baseplate J/gp47 family protein [Dehalobacter sp.]|nr:baseplate J/gp47 family protein [Dehalobacter sp.]
MLGATPKEAKPAHVDLSFSSAEKAKLVKKMPVSTEIAGKKIYFFLDENLTDEELIIVPAAFALEKLIVDELTGGVFDRTGTNQDGDLFFAPFGEQVQAGCTLYLGFGEDPASPPEALSFMCYLYEKDLKTPGSHGDEQEYEFKNAKLKWEIWDPSGEKPWKEVNPMDNTAGFKKSGRIIFSGLEGWTATHKISVMSFEKSYFWLRCRVEETNYEYPPRIEKIRLNTIPATHDLNAASKNEKEDAEEGNLKAGHSWEIEGFKHLEIINYMPSAGDRNAKSIKEAFEDFLRDFKVPYTAVTTSDYEYITLNTPGLRVAKAMAVPNYRPFYSQKTKFKSTEPVKSEYSKGSVTVVVIPYTPLEILKVPPTPSAGFIQAVCRHLDRHRLLGTKIHVISPFYVKVTVNATIVPLEGYLDDRLILRDVISALNSYLHPVKGGSERQGWPIGRDVYLSELYELMETVEGVKCIIRLSVSGEPGTTRDAQGNLLLGSKFSSIYSGKHSIEIAREAESCLKRGGLNSGN